MATIFVLYDPNDQVVIPREGRPEGLKIASMAIVDDNGAEIDHVTRRLAKLLLEQFYTPDDAA